MDETEGYLRDVSLTGLLPIAQAVLGICASYQAIYCVLKQTDNSDSAHSMCIHSKPPAALEEYH